MITNINMFYVCMVVVAICKCDGGLVVTMKGGGFYGGQKQLLNKLSKPNSFFGSVCSCHIFGLGCQECEGTPGFCFLVS